MSLVNLLGNDLINEVYFILAAHLRGDSQLPIGPAQEPAPQYVLTAGCYIIVSPTDSVGGLGFDPNTKAVSRVRGSRGCQQNNVSSVNETGLMFEVM